MANDICCDADGNTNFYGTPANALLHALSGPLDRLTQLEHDGMPEGMDPLSDEDGICVRIGELRAIRIAALNLTQAQEKLNA